ncbi:MAG: tetratricopeptide repeat protein, partial [Pirellula sp.]
WGNNNNRPNWNNGNTNVNINNNNFNNNWYNNNYNRPAWDRPGYNNNWGNNNWGNNWGYRPNYNWNNGWHDNCVHPHYHGWYNGCWSGYWGSSWYSPIVWGGIGWGLGSITNSYFNTGYAAYSNPYYVAPAVGTTTVASSVPYDYSQPVVVNNYITAESQGSTASSTSSPTTNANPTSNANIEASFGDFDKGLSSFKEGNYQAALNSFNTALSKNSGDPVVHEVRALSLFALGDYTSAAVALNSLLAAAPGMDWTTVSSLYGNSDDYTAQLRKLEEYCKANPKNPASAFVLAYHYLVIGQKESAIRALKVVVENQPKDVTAKRMLEALDPKPIEAKAAAPKTEGQPQAEELAKPAPEVDLVGKWQAAAGTTTIDLSIDEESKFVWKATESGKPAVELSGDFGTNGSAVLMETTDKGSLGGTVKSINADEWILNPPGATDDTAGLKFKRVK